MEDKITKMFFEPDRWIYAIEKGCVKGIRKNELYQLTKPEVRVAMYEAVKNGQYEIAPPHTALIPKDTPGEFRTVYVNEPIDRIFLSIANDLLFDGGKAKWFRGKRIRNDNTHGTGCTLSSAIAANLAKGFSLEESVGRAKEYISGALSAMLDIGAGSGPMAHNFALTGRFAEEAEA